MRSTSFSLLSRLLTLLVTLLICEPVIGQELNRGCRYPSVPGQGSFQVGNCSGNSPEEVLLVLGSYQVTATLSCKQNGWKQDTGQDLGWWAQQGQAVCGYAPEGTPPVCEPGFMIPMFTEERDDGVVMNGMIDDAKWTGTQCRWDGQWRDFPQFFRMEGCCDPFCADEYACNHVGESYGAGCQCVISPIVLDLDGNGIHLSSWEDGVQFDLACNGKPGPIAWTGRGESDAFLAMDRDGNGTVTSGCELFGSATPQPAVEHPNGFNALRPYDSNGDSRIDSCLRRIERNARRSSC